MEQLSIKITAEGSTTVYSSRFDQYYHSVMGGFQESEVVFINLGLRYAFEHFKEIHILEMGFGTGLNALLTHEACKKEEKSVSYTSLEAYPITAEMLAQLSFDTRYLHDLPWHQKILIDPFFTFEKIETNLQDFKTEQRYHLVYYDAFAPQSQPELWTQEIFEKIAAITVSGGILVTYCSKVSVQKNLQAAGFRIEKHPGPARKREILRAVRV